MVAEISLTRWSKMAILCISLYHRTTGHFPVTVLELVLRKGLQVVISQRKGST